MEQCKKLSRAVRRLAQRKGDVCLSTTDKMWWTKRDDNREHVNKDSQLREISLQTLWDCQWSLSCLFYD